MKYVRKTAFVLVVLFVVFYLVTRPEESAGSVRTVLAALSSAGSSIVTFVTALVS